MSKKVSAKSVKVVELTLTEEAASLVRQLAYSLNWDQFPVAEEIVDSIGELDLDSDVDIEYNGSTGEFVRA